MAIRLKDLVAGQQRLAQQEEQPIRINREQFARLVDVLSNKAEAKGSVNQVAQPRIFEEFVRQTQRREELLKDATDDQKVIFDKLSDSINKLKDANKSDSLALRRVIDQLTRKLSRTADTGARKGMMSALPAPATRTVTPASRLTSGPYTPFEGSAAIGTTEDTGESPMLSDFLKNLMQGNNRGNSESLIRNAKDLLGEGFEDYLQYRMMKDALKRTPPGGPVVVGGPKQGTVNTQGGKFKQAKNGQWYQEGRKGTIKKPGLAARSVNKIANLPGMKLLGKIKAGPMALVSGGLIGLNEYAESGDVSRAVAKGGVNTLGTFGGAAAGAALGTMILPGIGTAIGGVLGGLAGSYGIEKTGAGDFAADLVSDPTKAVKDTFNTIKGYLEPMAQENQAKIMQDLGVQNQEMYTNPNVPNIVIPSINQSAPAKQENNFLLPQAPARNTESTLEKFLNRNYF
jgi:phage-related tail protein